MPASNGWQSSIELITGNSLSNEFPGCFDFHRSFSTNSNVSFEFFTGFKPRQIYNLHFFLLQRYFIFSITFCYYCLFFTFCQVGNQNFLLCRIMIIKSSTKYSCHWAFLPFLSIFGFSDKLFVVGYFFLLFIFVTLIREVIYLNILKRYKNMLKRWHFPENMTWKLREIAQNIFSRFCKTFWKTFN